MIYTQESYKKVKSNVFKFFFFFARTLEPPIIGVSDLNKRQFGFYHHFEALRYTSL